MTEYVFSYGSIKDKYPNRTHIKGVLRDYFEEFDGNMFPELYESEFIHEIEGVVIGVNNDELAIIDMYEGYPDVYTREQYRIKTEIGNIIAWVYYIRD